jgi:hypothetical protein
MSFDSDDTGRGDIALRLILTKYPDPVPSLKKNLRGLILEKLSKQTEKQYKMAGILQFKLDKTMRSGRSNTQLARQSSPLEYRSYYCLCDIEQALIVDLIIV